MIKKTKVLTLIFFGLLFYNLSANTIKDELDPVAELPDENRKFRFGLQFNPNISWLKTGTSGYQNEGTKLGFSYGLSVEYFLSKNYLFSTGLILLHSGGKIAYKGTTDHLSIVRPANVETKYSLKYIELPLMLKLRTNEIGYLTYFGQFGFKTGFNYGAGSDIDYTYKDSQTGALINNSVSNGDASDEINWINIALAVGVGVEYNISGNTGVMLGLTFNNGFVNQLDLKTHLIDSNGEAIVDSNSGEPLLSNKVASANLNYFTLNIGVYF